MYDYRRLRENVEGVEMYRYPFIEAKSGALAYAFEFGWCLLCTWLLSMYVVLTRGRFQLIHACNPPDTFWLVGLFWRPFGTRFLFDEHDVCPAVYEAKFRTDAGDAPNPRLTGILRWLERQSLRHADAVVNVCESYRDESIRKGADPAKCFVVRSAPDLSRFRLVERVEELREGHAAVGVYLGVMGPQDGLDLLVGAIGEFVNGLGRRDCLFILIGDGPSRAPSMRLAEELGIMAHVRFPGYVSGERLLQLLSIADFGMIPDPKTPFNDMTAMNKAYEYPALRLPFVAFDLQENRRTAGEEAGRYVPAHDLRRFAEEMAVLCDDPELRRRMGEAGRRHIEAHHTWGHAEKHLLQACQYALGDEGAAPGTAVWG
jgi:glycosyltransferase involved in cell wall biosynthesis